MVFDLVTGCLGAYRQVTGNAPGPFGARCAAPIFNGDHRR
jgi:hypothetical protein